MNLMKREVQAVHYIPTQSINPTHRDDSQRRPLSISRTLLRVHRVFVAQYATVESKFGQPLTIQLTALLVVLVVVLARCSAFDII